MGILATCLTPVQDVETGLTDGFDRGQSLFHAGEIESVHPLPSGLILDGPKTGHESPRPCNLEGTLQAKHTLAAQNFSGAGFASGENSPSDRGKVQCSDFLGRKDAVLFVYPSQIPTIGASERQTRKEQGIDGRLKIDLCGLISSNSLGEEQPYAARSGQPGGTLSIEEVAMSGDMEDRAFWSELFECFFAGFPTR